MLSGEAEKPEELRISAKPVLKNGVSASFSQGTGPESSRSPASTNLSSEFAETTEALARNKAAMIGQERSRNDPMRNLMSKVRAFRDVRAAIGRPKLVYLAQLSCN